MKKYGDKIEFKLDGAWSGEGTIVNVWSQSYEVELTKPCKEYPIGMLLLVYKKEVTSS